MAPKPYITAHSGAFLRNPHGGVEDVAEMKAALGPDCWLALNLGDGQTWEDWRVVITRARALKVQVFPWARCRTLAECYTLLDQADLVGFRAILNLETELEGECPPDKVREVMDDFDLFVSFSCNGWLQNDVDFSPIAHRPVLLQLFISDMKREVDDIHLIQDQCLGHAIDKGFKHVGFTYQSYDPAEPEWYAYAAGKPRSYFTGDDIGAGNWDEWKP